MFKFVKRNHPKSCLDSSMLLTRSILAQICDSTSFGTRAYYIQSLKLPNLKEGSLGQTCYMLKGEHACIEDKLGL